MVELLDHDGRLYRPCRNNHFKPAIIEVSFVAYKTDMANKKTEERVKAADLFINSTTLTLKHISAIVGVSPKQLGIWAKEEDWELQRTANQVTVDKIIAGNYTQLAAIQKIIKDEQKGIPTPAQTDQQHKLSDAIEKLKKKQNLSTYHTALTELLHWMNKRNVDDAKKFAPLMLEFMKDKAKTIRHDS
jgi:hypothetical protein